MNNNIYPKKIFELVDVFNNIRVPLSSNERKQLAKIYPYYGAQSIVDYVDDYLFDGEYLLVAEDGENLRSKNQNICNLVNGKFWVNNHAHILRANIDNVTKYLYYNFNRINFEAFVTGSAQPKLNKENLLNIVTYVHNKLDQQKIVGVLSALDDKIELNNQINTELEAMAKTLYDYWFVQFDFPDENGKPYQSSGGKMVFNETLKREIPDGWDFIEIETLLRKNERAKKVNAKDYLLEGNLPVIDQSTDFIAGFTNDLSYKIIFKDEPAIIFGDHTRILKLINFDFARGADGTQVIYSNNSRMPQYLFYYSLKKIDLSNYGYARHFKFLKSSKVLLPLKEPSKLFSDKVACFYKKIFINQKQNQELAQLRDWLLPMLMNGQVRVGSGEYEREEDGLGMVGEKEGEYKKK